MKSKSLWCLALILMISTSSFALEIYKGRLIKHREWTTVYAKGMFNAVDIKNRSLAVRNKMARTSESSDITVFSDAKAIQGIVNSKTLLDGEHYISIQNNTTTTQQYDYELSICVDTSTFASQCTYFNVEIQLDPTGYASDSEESNLFIQFTKPGIYHTDVSTNLAIENSTGGYYSESGGIVSVTSK